MTVEEALDKITESLPRVHGNGWVRKQDKDGAKIYEVRVKDYPVAGVTVRTLGS